MRKLRVLLVASEAVPYAKTGGLADVAGTLGVELRRKGVDASLMLPCYRNIRMAGSVRPLRKQVRIPLGTEEVRGSLHLTEGREGLPVYFVQHDGFFARDGLYGEGGADYPDNAARFVFFSRAVLEAIGVLGLAPDIIHCHDWQTGLIPFYLKSLYRSAFPGLGTVYTIHNLGYQGLFWHYDMPLLGVGWEYFHMNALEFYGKINFMKAGIVFGDRITTVSPNYAREIQTAEGGFGLDGVLRARSGKITGILNGLDTEEWNPSTDRHIPRTFGPDTLKDKAFCRAQLRRECDLRMRRDLPLISVVVRFSEQKGIDDVFRAADRFVGTKKAQMVILGSGDPEAENKAMLLADKYPGYLYAQTGFNDGLAHRIYAGSDIFLMPSRYEPCGLGQMIAMRYGTVPVVRKTGGLADTVREKGPHRNGYVFSGATPASFLGAVQRAVDDFSSEAQWACRVNNGMTEDYSWGPRVDEYVRLYAGLVMEGKGA